MHAIHRKNKQICDIIWYSDDCKMILDYLKYKLEVPAYEWRRILKVMHKKHIDMFTY